MRKFYCLEIKKKQYIIKYFNNGLNIEKLRIDWLLGRNKVTNKIYSKICQICCKIWWFGIEVKRL